MGSKNFKLKINNPYDTLVKILLIWCVLQDFVLCVLLRITGADSVIKIIFHGKDVLLIVLFLVAIFKKKIPFYYGMFSFAYFFIIIIQTYYGFAENSLDFMSMLSAIRGLILLPMLTLIGYGIKDSDSFYVFVKKYYYFLFYVAVVGLIEFFVDIILGTKSFWMDALALNDFYSTIKGNAIPLEDGTPGNWYTDIGGGYRTQKRLISIWAAPLTSGFVLLMPCMYYTIVFFSRKKLLSLRLSNEYFYDMKFFSVFAIALLLTFTRQTLLLYIILAFGVFVYYRRNSRILMLIGGIVFFLVGMIVLWESAIDYLYNGSTMVHILQLENAISQITFWGNGIGAFGTRFPGAIATESHYLTMIGQLGVLSLIPYLVLFIVPISSSLKWGNNIKNDNKLFIYSVCFCGLVYVLAGVVSETVDAFTSIAQYYVLIGYVWSCCRESGRCV